MDIQARTMWMPSEVFVADIIPEDERLWVQTRKNSWFRPLLLSVSQGFWITVARFAADGIVSRHSHPQAVHGHVLKGQWRYLEHDWLARPGSYVYEPPGETHTLVVDGSAGEMITIFQVFGAIVYHD